MPCARNSTPPSFARLLVEHVDKGGADRLALFLGVGDAGELGKKQIAGVAMDERDVVMAAEQVDDLLGLAGAQQARYRQRCRSAGRRSPRAAAPRRRPNRPRPRGRRRHLPWPTWRRMRSIAWARNRAIVQSPRQPATLWVKLRSSSRALRRVRDLGMKQRAVKPPLVVGDRGKGRALARGDRAETRRQRVDPVAMAHPHLLARALRPQPVEQQAVVEDVDKGAAEFLMLAQATRPPNSSHIVCMP